MAIGNRVAFLCDRRIFTHKGTWQNPQDDKPQKIFYYVSKPLSLVNEYDEYGKETLVPTISIVIFGGKPICSRDIIVLQDGSKMRVESFTINYFESNILVRDLIKPKIASIELVLK